MVYRHNEPSGAGFREGADAAQYMNDMIHFTFGHPTGVALDEERALAVWYAGDETRTQIWGADPPRPLRPPLGEPIAAGQPVRGFS